MIVRKTTAQLVTNKTHRSYKLSFWPCSMSIWVAKIDLENNLHSEASYWKNAQFPWTNAHSDSPCHWNELFESETSWATNPRINSRNLQCPVTFTLHKNSKKIWVVRCACCGKVKKCVLMRQTCVASQTFSAGWLPCTSILLWLPCTSILLSFHLPDNRKATGDCRRLDIPQTWNIS